MYVVIEAGGKQYRVAPGDVIRVERMQSETGAQGALERLLAVSPGDGTILTGDQIAQAKVEATVLSHGRGKKVVVFHYKRKKQYKKSRGHRQDYTQVRVDNITV